MKNLISDGNTQKFTAPEGGVSSGGIVVFNEGPYGHIGVSFNDVEAGEVGIARVTGVFELPAPDDEAWSAGEPLYYDSTAGKITTTSTGNTPAGKAWQAKKETATVGQIDLRGPGAFQPDPAIT